MKNLIEVIADNSITIVAIALIFLSGVGIGAAITEAINNMKENDKHEKTR